jgi:hypothetical protein
MTHLPPSSTSISHLQLAKLPEIPKLPKSLAANMGIKPHIGRELIGRGFLHFVPSPAAGDFSKSNDLAKSNDLQLQK